MNFWGQRSINLPGNDFSFGISHSSKLEKVLDENVTPQFQYFLFIWPLVMSNLAIWQNSVGIQDHKGKKTLKKGKFWSFLANFDLVLPLKFWMPTDFNNLAYFGITNVQMNGKYWNRDVTFSSRTIFHFEQCANVREIPWKKEFWNFHLWDPDSQRTFGKIALMASR